MTKMTLPMVEMPGVIRESVRAVLCVHGLTLSPDLLREIGNNTTQALYGIDENLDSEESDAAMPSTADRLAVGQTLRALAAAGRPNAETAEALARVGDWLANTAKAELAKDKAA